MAPRRIIRTLVQTCLFAAALFLAVVFLDSRYKVLPTSIHNRFPAPHWHHTGYVITDINYQSCNKIFGPQCTLGEDWHQIEKDVFLGTSILYRGYLFVKRMKEEDFDKDENGKTLMITDVAISKAAPGEGWESRPGDMWIKRSNKLVEDGVTAVDILFGMDVAEVRPQWTIVGTMGIGEKVRLTIRKGQPEIIEKPELRINDNMKFKIIQISDMHLSTGPGTCRDLQPGESVAGCDADPRTLDYIEKILDIEKPDLAVLGGDQVNGDTAPDAQTAIFKFADIFIRRKLPYACILGNHDDRGNLNRAQLMQIIERLPYSLSSAGPPLGPLITDKFGHQTPEGGVGNYLIEVLAHRSHSHQSAMTLYFFDTHAYSPKMMEHNGKRFRVYDWVKESQIKWFMEEHDKLEKQHEKYPYMHLDMAFIHIPLPEVRSQTNHYFGIYNEPATAPFENSGLATALVQHGVSIVSAGHDHTNEFCMLESPDATSKGGLWMCQSGVAGFGGYAKSHDLVTKRKVRLFEVDPQARRVTTWKRVEGSVDQRFEEAVLMEEGRTVNVELS
ncbi:Metallo-dependent phosphatase-like protein [Kalaharituber pfeilii]|nr:Metallo-dependent phosphatase-like protein [Kalaharituber pfeilii]